MQMREILFRGKRIDNGEWVYGFYFERKDTGGKIIESVIINDAYEQIMYGQRFLRSNMFRECFRIHTSTVGQFTGLTDKNGKQIFEGDIVKTSDITYEGVIQIPGESFEIAMRKGCWVMVAGEDWDFLGTNHECIEVIGNIHDNFELLEETNS